MASNVPLIGGYDCKFVDTPPDKLGCQICLLVARTPHQAMCCGKVYCKACLDEHKRHSNTCPNCRKTGQNFPDVRGEQEIKALKVKCNNVKSGCGWIGELRSLDNHLTTCGYALLRCTNKCTKKTEEVHVLRRDMDNHLKHKCPNRQYQCPHCKDKGSHCEITTTHLDTCPKLKIRCPNARCNVSVPRCEISVHRTKCRFEEVRCKYAEIGCEEELLRKDLQQHENDHILHLQLAVETVSQQQKEMKAMKEEQEVMKEEQRAMKEDQRAMKEEQRAMKEEQRAMKEEQRAMKEEQRAMKEEQRAIEEEQRARKEEQRAMKEEQEVMKDVIVHTQPSPCVLKMPKFNQHKISQDTWCSPPFYIHPGSYKMCISVYANGNGSGEGTHISVYAFLMRGKNDDNLSWPFTGKVTITLLNQLGDKNHHTKAVTFPQEVHTKVNVRVVNSDRAHSGYGRPEFISHNQLGYDAKQNCQYLKDDCLYFRVPAEASDPLKPWVTCTN